jgi:membrane protein DedA with SNARE-associated domain
MGDRWPFKYRPELFERAQTVFKPYGIVAVFIGYFIGPPVPVAADIAGIPYVRFHVATVLSAVVWALTVVTPTAVLGQSFGSNDPILLLTPTVVPALTIGTPVAAILLRRFCTSDTASPSKRLGTSLGKSATFAPRVAPGASRGGDGKT